jgi:hypothetical protein
MVMSSLIDRAASRRDGIEEILPNAITDNNLICFIYSIAAGSALKCKTPRMARRF